MVLTYEEREFFVSLLSSNKQTLEKGYYVYHHKGNLYFEHRILMELILGRKLRDGEIVHHKDHDKSNNHPHNLEIMKSYDHLSLHHAGSKKPSKNRNNLPHKLNEDKIKEIKELSKVILKKNGKPHFSKIAEKIGVSDFTVARHLKE